MAVRERRSVASVSQRRRRLLLSVVEYFEGKVSARETSGSELAFFCRALSYYFNPTYQVPSLNVPCFVSHNRQQRSEVHYSAVRL